MPGVSLVQGRVPDAELPRWLAEPYARLCNAQAPIDAYKRALELWELTLSWIVLCVGVRQSNQPEIRSAIQAKARRDDGTEKRLALGDRVDLVCQLTRLASGNVLQIASRHHHPTDDPVSRAVAILRAAPARGTTFEDLFRALPPDRNQFAHQVADDATCSAVAVLLQTAFERLVASTPGFAALEMVYVERVQVQRAPDGLSTIHEADLFVLRGSAALVLTKARVNPIAGQSLWLRDRNTTELLSEVPPWLGRWRNNSLEIFDGYVAGNPHFTSAVPTIRVVRGEATSTLDHRAPGVIVKGPPPSAALACDSPPRTDNWVGRLEPLEHLRAGTEPVVFITGIGGQGKSMLAAKFVEEACEREHNFEAWDWRDCREESGRLRGHLAALVERVSDGAVTARAVADAEPALLVAELFRHLGARPWLFVFDNVDHFINQESHAPAAELAPLVEAAARRRHGSRFVFTCRPAVELDNSNSFHLPLAPFTQADAGELFAAFRVKLPPHELERAVADAFQLTGGHPFWMSLVARRFVQGGECGREMLDRIRDHRGPQPTSVLESVWRDLSEPERVLLRALAEISRPHSQPRLAELTAEYTENRNRFERRFKSLRTLGLIVERRTSLGAEFDLHPLLRHYVRQRYEPAERTSYISSIKRMCDTFRKQFLTLVGGATSRHPMLDNEIDRIELAANLGDFEEALVTLSETVTLATELGRLEDLARTGIYVLRHPEVNWSRLVAEDQLASHTAIHALSEVLVKLGRGDEARELLGRYGGAIAPGSAPYVNLCNTWAYVEWFEGRFAEAVEWGRRGVAAKGDADITYDASNNLALALRDGGAPREAMGMFLEGRDLATLLGSSLNDISATVYGNAGRCLYLMDRPDDALRCFWKSFGLLRADTDTGAVTNQGYACLWIAEALERADAQLAFVFAREAGRIWAQYAVARTRLPLALIQRLEANMPAAVRSLTDSELRQRVDAALAERFRV